MKDEAARHPEPVVLCRLSIVEAQLLAGRLRQERIESLAGSDYQPAAILGPEIGGITDVLVPRDRLDDARRILASFSRERGG